MMAETHTQLIPWWRIQYTEADVQGITQAIRGEHISLGPLTAEFEKKISEKLSVPYVVATTSGSMALLMALMVLGVGPNDEVIIPNRTWIAAAHAVTMLGAKVILVDVQKNIPIIDVNQIEAHITPKTKAIIPTALSGRAVNMPAIHSIAKKYNLFVVEDAAQAIFSKEDAHYAGTQSDIGCFSMSVAKLLPTGQGGFTVTHNENFYQALRSIRTHGVADLLHCEYQRFGFNFRFTDLQAALGLSQLETIANKIENLNRIYQLYEKGLANCKAIRLIPVRIEQGEVPLYIEVLTSERDKLVSFLQTQHIQVKVFYPNLNRATYFNCHNSFPHADVFESQGVTLPCGPDQSIENIQRVVSALQAFDSEMSRKEVAIHAS